MKEGKRGPKIFLYSAHETTLSAVLWALKAWKPEIPEYSSSVILELWEKDSEYYVKVSKVFKWCKINDDVYYLYGYANRWCSTKGFHEKRKIERSRDVLNSAPLKILKIYCTTIYPKIMIETVSSNRWALSAVKYIIKDSLLIIHF